MSPLRWMNKNIRLLAATLNEQGFSLSHTQTKQKA
jgi:molybdopterin-biosynthesis enzyme MoeA-like protein